MMPPMAHVGAYMMPSGVVTGASTHLEPTAALGSNDHIWLVEATLMLNPPRIYILLPVSAKPPGRIVPMAPGQLSPPPRVTTESLTGVYETSRPGVGFSPGADRPAQRSSGVPPNSAPPKAILFIWLSGSV